jgi:hypothetical protein
MVDSLWHERRRKEPSGYRLQRVVRGTSEPNVLATAISYTPYALRVLLPPFHRLVLTRSHNECQAALFAHGVGMGAGGFSPMVVTGLQ